ncbi:hypothetical protein F0562_031331 [Nyssa sinensis]|uniref:Iron-binding zinc finger CDGSH type domain-containing protein n=1 Tax=Nyssa sinensis TaxID=561372 RepID=A0A5J5AU62_9ASTE|nr:hypothetical protein F0562_031331 [Nyssa sinensis]
MASVRSGKRKRKSSTLSSSLNYPSPSLLTADVGGPGTFPLCDGSHVKHNKATGDNVGPLLLKKQKQ